VKTGTLWTYFPVASGSTVKKQTNTPVADYSGSRDLVQRAGDHTDCQRSRSDPRRRVPIAYQLKITQDGLLSFSYSLQRRRYQNVLPTATSRKDNATLPGLLRFGFAGSTAAAPTCMNSLFPGHPAQLADTSVGVNQKQATRSQRHPGIPGDVLFQTTVGHRDGQQSAVRRSVPTGAHQLNGQLGCILRADRRRTAEWLREYRSEER